jgi:hypothetical protein
MAANGPGENSGAAAETVAAKEADPLARGAVPAPAWLVMCLALLILVGGFTAFLHRTFRGSRRS